MSGYDQGSIAVPMPTVVGSAAALAGPFKIKSSEAFSGALMTVSGLTGETISVQTSPDGYQGAPASPSFYRTDWQGTSLLYSSARTNEVQQSQTLNTTWTKSSCSITSDAITAPDGTLTADKIVEAAVSARHELQSANTTIPTPILSTYSVYAKAGERQYLFLTPSGTATLSATFDLVAGTVTNTGGSCVSSIQSMGNGWYRCVITFTSTVVNSGLWCCIRATAGLGVETYLGDGTSGLYCWGAQAELGGVATAYIPTTTAVTITDYTLSNGVITLAQAPITGATLSYDNSVLPSPYYIFATGDGVRTQFAYDGVWGTLSANSAKGNGIWQVDLRGAQAYRLVKSAGAETATVNMTLKRDALQYKNTAGTWSVT